MIGTTDAGFGLAPLPSTALSVVLGSGALMVFWVLSPFPGSAYTGIQWHDELASNIWSAFQFNPLIGPESLVLKYNTLGQAPALLHALPGAVWCGLAPFQVIQYAQMTFDVIVPKP
eukprot:1178818-Prorocentrum_minimum.AAC.5